MSNLCSEAVLCSILVLYIVPDKLVWVFPLLLAVRSKCFQFFKQHLSAILILENDI